MGAKVLLRVHAFLQEGGPIGTAGLVASIVTAARTWDVFVSPRHKGKGDCNKECCTGHSVATN
jgi:hypothetical protein